MTSPFRLFPIEEPNVPSVTTELRALANDMREPVHTCEWLGCDTDTGSTAVEFCSEACQNKAYNPRRPRAWGAGSTADSEGGDAA